MYSYLFKQYKITEEEFDNWLKKNENKSNPDLEIQMFRKNFALLKATEGQVEFMLDKLRKQKDKEKIKEENSDMKTRIHRFGYNRNIKDKDGNNVYTELGVNRHGGKRKRKTLKRKKSVRKSKKSRKGRKGRKSKKSRKTRRR